jgi:hypothetical protein
MLKAGQATELAELIKWTRSGDLFRKTTGRLFGPIRMGNLKKSSFDTNIRLRKSPTAIEKGERPHGGNWFCRSEGQ